MRIRKLHIVWFWGLLLLMSACGEDDYYYPSVKLEFVTVKAGTDGSIQTLIPDNGEALTVSKDRTGSAFERAHGYSCDLFFAISCYADT